MSSLFNNGINLLLVEDNPKDEYLTLRALKKMNLVDSIDVVRDGAEALDYLFGRGKYSDRDIEDLPTVVLLDLKLPKISGIEVLREIRANQATKRLPVAILSSSDEVKDILTCYDMHANSYVRKPIAANDYNDAIASLGKYWVTVNEPPPYN